MDNCQFTRDLSCCARPGLCTPTSARARIDFAAYGQRIGAALPAWVRGEPGWRRAL